jgi:serine/threonine protein kinase
MLSCPVTYTQSHCYRSPEVTLQMDFDFGIDVWPAGCVAAELFLRLPLFLSQSQGNLLGPFPMAMPRPQLPVNRQSAEFQSYFGHSAWTGRKTGGWAY